MYRNQGKKTLKIRHYEFSFWVEIHPPPDTMPKPSIYQHRFYLLKFTEFDPHQKGFLPSQILSMTLTLCQNPASKNTDFTFSSLQNLIHLWKDSYLLCFFNDPDTVPKSSIYEHRFCLLKSHRNQSMLEEICTFSNAQTVTHLGKDSYLLMFTKFNPPPGKDA